MLEALRRSAEVDDIVEVHWRKTKNWHFARVQAIVYYIVMLLMGEIVAP